MSPLAAHLRILPRALKPLHPVPVRSFHSPFVVLSASNPLSASPSTATPIYEKQDDSSPEPHLSSSGTRTYVVSEPDPSNTPYEVPSGAYPASAPYVAIPQEADIGESTAVRNTGVPGETGRRGATLGGIGAASIKPGEF